MTNPKAIREEILGKDDTEDAITKKSSEIAYKVPKIGYNGRETHKVTLPAHLWRELDLIVMLTGKKRSQVIEDAVRTKAKELCARIHPK